MNINMLLQLDPTTYTECEYGLQEWKEQVPKGDVMSSPSKGRFTRWARGAECNSWRAGEPEGSRRDCNTMGKQRGGRW